MYKRFTRIHQSMKCNELASLYIHVYAYILVTANPNSCFTSADRGCFENDMITYVTYSLNTIKNFKYAFVYNLLLVCVFFRIFKMNFSVIRLPAPLLLLMQVRSKWLLLIIIIFFFWNHVTWSSRLNILKFK